MHGWHARPRGSEWELRLHGEGPVSDEDVERRASKVRCPVRTALASALNRARNSDCVPARRY